MGTRKMIASTTSFVKKMEREIHVKHHLANALTIIEERHPCCYTHPGRMEKTKHVRIYDIPMKDGSYIRRYDRVVSSVVHGVGQKRYAGAPGIVIHRRLQFSTVFLADLPLPSRTCILKRQLSSIVPLVRHLPRSIN